MTTLSLLCVAFVALVPLAFAQFPDNRCDRHNRFATNGFVATGTPCGPRHQDRCRCGNDELRSPSSAGRPENQDCVCVPSSPPPPPPRPDDRCDDANRFAQNSFVATGTPCGFGFGGNCRCGSDELVSSTSARSPNNDCVCVFATSSDTLDPNGQETQAQPSLQEVLNLPGL